MFAKKLNTLKPNATIVQDNRRAKMLGLYPVRLRITYNRKLRHYPTGLDLTDAEFQLTQNSSMLNKEISIEKRRTIKENKMLLDAIHVKANECLKSIEGFTFEEFESKMFGERLQIDSVYSLYESTIKHLKDNDRIGNAKNYSCSLQSLKSFKPNLKFSDVTVNFLNNYEKWLLKNGRSISTVGFYLRPLKALINVAIDNKQMPFDAYPFGKRKYQIPASKNIKKALTLEEIGKIYNYITIPNTWQQRAKDMWLFSYFANGINMKDIALLTHENIQGEYIRFIRAKTQHTNRTASKQISIFITPKLKEIMDRNITNSVGYLFPVLSLEQDAETKHKLIAQFIKNVNKNMKRIVEKIGIDKHVTTYNARHSFATVLKRSGVSTEFISESLGHSNIKTTASYLDSFEDEQRKETMKELSKF